MELNDFPNSFLDTEALSEEQIELSPAQMEIAARLSQSVADPSQQWQLYIHILGLLGFKQWLEEWAPDLEIDDSGGSIKQADDWSGACQISVAKFKLCLIAAPIFLDATVNASQAIIDLPQFVPHVYTLVEVQEEQMQVKVYGYLRRDWLIEQRQLHPLKPTSNQKYAIPLNWFNLDPTSLLLELRCLEPYPLTLPCPVNVSHWLNDRLDDVARQLGWLLLPPLAPAAALRSAQEEVQLLGVPIPSEARGAYQEIQSGTALLRLHAVTWVLSAAVDAFAWTLLIILAEEDLPVGTRLQVRDAEQLLSEQVAEAPDSPLFAQVGGDVSDRFWVTIDLPDGATIDLPPFYFGVDE
ncbi:DUF1822 family protein [Phormidium tenue FACHB-886]|nr:DUF1822 family protein [Phormidium tenue FACHB-886]